MLEIRHAAKEKPSLLFSIPNADQPNREGYRQSLPINSRIGVGTRCFRQTQPHEWLPNGGKLEKCGQK